MNRDDEYRRQAAEAEKQARSAISELERNEWLRIAQGWRGLLRKRPQSDDDSDTGAKLRPPQLGSLGRFGWPVICIFLPRLRVLGNPLSRVMFRNKTLDCFGFAIRP